MAKPVGIVCVEESATAAYALLSQNPTEDSDLAHGAVELLREILVAVRISDRYPQMKQALEFVKLALLLLKGLLLRWNCYDFPPKAQELPLQKLPLVCPNHCWHVEHPNRSTLAAEVKSSLRFMDLNALVFEHEPWVWLYDCLDALDVSLSN
jgi:hypothetical protein